MLIGRQKALIQLYKLLNKQSAAIMIYRKRRIGKTTLIKK